MSRTRSIHFLKPEDKRTLVSFKKPGIKSIIFTHFFLLFLFPSTDPQQRWTSAFLESTVPRSVRLMCLIGGTRLHCKEPACTVVWNLIGVVGYLITGRMTLRRPAAHLRKPPAWRRSEYESNWESLMAEEGEFSSIYHPPRAARPQSAIEGGQLDSWLEHLQRMQNELLRVQDQVPVLKEPTGHGCEQPFSRSSSSCGSPRLQSSYGSQETLQTRQLSPPECQGSWEKARITQVGKREQAQLSCIAPVKIGWLPIQRRVTVAADSKHSQFLDNSASQVKHLNKYFFFISTKECPSECPSVSAL